MRQSWLVLMYLLMPHLVRAEEGATTSSKADQFPPASEARVVPPSSPSDDSIKGALRSVDRARVSPDDFDKMMKDLKKDTAKKDNKPQPAAQSAKAQVSSPIMNPKPQYTIAEQDIIRTHISKNWTPPVGAKPVVVVQISFTLRADGTITDVRYETPNLGDQLWQQFADSARRAVLLSSPIPIPPKIGRAEERVIVNFDPREIMGISKGR